MYFFYEDENVEDKLMKIKEDYDTLLSELEYDATISERAFGGYLRSNKGELVEHIARELIQIAWIDVLKQDKERLSINKKKMPVYLTNKYGFIDRIKSKDVQNWMGKNKDTQIYKFGTDVQVFIDGKLVLPIECKAYTENAMIKRILVDASLMKKTAGCNKYFLLQLESQLGGDYSELNDVTYGSPSTNALLSHFDVELEIITLLKGERKVNEPIHVPEFFKELDIVQLEKALNIFVEELKKFI